MHHRINCYDCITMTQHLSRVAKYVPVNIHALLHGHFKRSFVSYLKSLLLVRNTWCAQLVETLRYKSEGRGFDSRWCHWNFSFAKSFRPHYGPGFDSTFNRNEYQQYFLGE